MVCAGKEALMECMMEKNKTRYNCTYEPGGRKYRCGGCIQPCRQIDKLPACLFTRGFERPCDRSTRDFLGIKGEA